MAAPTIVTSSTNSGAGTTGTLTVPTGSVSSNLLLTIIGCDRGSSVSSIDSSWTSFGSVDDANIAIFAATAPGDAGTTFTMSSARNWFAYTARIQDFTTSNLGSSFNGVSASSNPIAPAVTAPSGSALVVYAVSMDGNSNPFTPPAGTTEVYDEDATNISGAVAIKTMASSGDTGTGTFGSSGSDQWAAFTIAIGKSTGAAPSSDSTIRYIHFQHVMSQ